jgi:uncharacterized repeat protein (TIGR01451 family)
MCNRMSRAGAFGCWLAVLIGTAHAQAAPDPLSIKTIAEVEAGGGTAAEGEARHLKPADRLVAGDKIFYTLEVRNVGAATLDAPTITHPIPPHTYYIADSAVGPGTLVRYSVDGGHSFDRPENLRVPVADGSKRPATASDYTHIRWQLTSRLQVNSVAFVRFRAVVK